MLTNSFSDNIIAWYRAHKRSLPWRENKNPYPVWISEIILQQTRISQGLPYYEAFLEKYPTVTKLATAAESEILRLWQGLGYYSRARNLHQCAKQIATDFNGVFPNNYKDLLALKGIGPYTAAAIASICFNEAVPVIDGNVIRVITRYFGINDFVNETTGRKKIQQAAEKLMPNINCGDYNQGLMELGSLVCQPRNPMCKSCPISANCATFRDGKWESRPAKKQKKKSRDRYLHFVFCVNEDQTTWIQKRADPKDIWLNLYQPPVIEYTEPPADKIPGISGTILSQKELPIHKLSHQNLHTTLWVIKTAETPNFKNMEKVALHKLEGLPKPQLIVRYLSLLEDDKALNLNFD